MAPGPWLRADFVASLDGAVEISGRSRELGGAADRAAFMAMRAVSDVVMVGAGTARGGERRAREAGERIGGETHRAGQSRRPRLAVVSASGSLPRDLPLFSGDDPPLVVTTSSGLTHDPSLVERAEVIDCGQSTVDLSVALRHFNEMGLLQVLSEGGPTLLRTLIVQDLLDELCLTTSPVVTGAGPRRLTGDEPLVSPQRFTLTALLQGDDLLLARYGRRSGE